MDAILFTLSQKVEKKEGKKKEEKKPTHTQKGNASMKLSEISSCMVYKNFEL